MARVSDIGVDIGTSNVLIYMKNKGIVLREPAVVAVDRDTNTVLAVGSDAYRMIGRTPGNVVTVRPLKQGAIVDFDLLNTMVRQFVTSVTGKRLFSRPRAVVSVPSGVTDAEKRSIISMMFDTGAKNTQLLERPLAAALGVGLDFTSSYGIMIVDIGAGMTDIAVISSSQVMNQQNVLTGGDYFNDAVVRYLRKKYNLLIGERTADDLKIHLGSAVKPANVVTYEVTGRNLISGMPKVQTVTNMEVYEALKEPVAELIEQIQAVLERTSPQLTNDIFEEGIILTGGGALLTGLGEAIYSVLNIPCAAADNPEACICVGCGRALDYPDLMQQLKNENRRMGRV